MNNYAEAWKAAGGLILALLIIVGSICLYMLPYIIAKRKNKRNLNAIGILNLLLGWTLIGWVGALIWALCEDR